MSRTWLLLIGGLFVSTVRAQNPPGPLRVVRGVVFDSIKGAALAGAVVQVVRVGPAESAQGSGREDASARVFAGTTDTGGHFRIQGLPVGQFAIGFQHEALNALRLESPLRAFELRNDTSVTVNLAIPPGPVVRSQVCGDSVRLVGEGLLVGYVFDARGEGLLPGAVIRARWLEFALEHNNYHAVTRVVTSVVGDDGRYLACGLTSDEAIAVEVTMPGRRAVAGRISVPVSGAVRQDFWLADTVAVPGTLRLAGRVVLPSGAGLPFGQAEIAALSLSVPVVNGEFTFTGIPAGTWLVEARAIGHEPRSVLVGVREREVSTARITLDDRVQQLAVVSVVGRRGGDTKILSAITGRRSTSIGSAFLPGNEWLESAYDPADVVRGAPGFRYVNPEVLLSSGCGFRYPSPDEPRLALGPVRARTRTLAVYLDGLRVVGGLSELRTAVTMRDVLAVEAYQDVMSAPLEWRTNDACAVLAIWTKR